MKKNISRKTFIIGCLVTFFITPVAWAGLDQQEVSDTTDLNQLAIEVQESDNERPFKLKIKTDNPGQTDEKSFQISTNPDYSYNYKVDCDSDGVYEAASVRGNYTCRYDSIGEYTVSISGAFPHLVSSRYLDAKKIISLEQWGDIEWRSMRRAFMNSVNMVGNASDIPNLTLVEDTREMFKHARSFNQNINNWDVSSVTTMREMFYNAIAFDQPLDFWDVSNVTDMRTMFFRADAFNQSLDAWDVSSVTNMDMMFYLAIAFNQPLNAWDVSNVTSMNFVFFKANDFNQPLDAWDVSSVTSMYRMFSHTNAFNQPLNVWDVSSVKSMSRMFDSASAFNQPLDAWNISSVRDMGRMFYKTSAFNQPLDAWNVSNVMNMKAMFSHAVNFENHDLSGWDVSSLYHGFRVRDRHYTHNNFFEGAGSGNIEPVWH